MAAVEAAEPADHWAGLIRLSQRLQSLPLHCHVKCMTEAERGRSSLSMTAITYNRYRFPPEIIQCGVWLYARFTPPLRNVEELLAERGIDVSNETARRRFQKFGGLIAPNLRSSRPCASTRWHLGEIVIKIRDGAVSLMRSSLQNSGSGSL